MSVPDTTPAATLRFAWKSDAMARATLAGAQSAGATASASAMFGKKEGEARGRKRKPRERERRIAERKREREKHVEKAIEDTVRKEGRRGTDMKSQGSRWFFAMKGKRGDHSERGGERRS